MVVEVPAPLASVERPFLQQQAANDGVVGLLQWCCTQFLERANVALGSVDMLGFILAEYTLDDFVMDFTAQLDLSWM